MELMKYQEIAEKLVEKSQGVSSQETEVYIVGSKDLSIEVNNGQIENMKSAENYGVGIRVIKDKKMGYSFTSDFSERALDECLYSAVENASKNSPDEANILPETKGQYPHLDLYDPKISKTALEDKIQIAMDMESYAQKYDSRVKIIENCTYQDAEYNVIIANSKGLSGSYNGAYCGAYTFLVAEENGDNQTGFDVQYSLSFKDINPQKIGEKAAENAVRMLGAKNICTQKAAIILEPYVATKFLGILSPSLSAEAVQKGKSLFKDKLGQKVASSIINIIDDGKMPGGILSSPFDGEGVPTKKNNIIQNGELKTFLHNSYTGHKDGVLSTGNAVRGSFKSTPEVGTTNFYIDKGEKSREKLLQEVDKGFYVTDVMGMHTANPISGDFSVGASGIWIENGEFTTSVKGVAIAGNILELLESVEDIADDLTFFVGKGSPTIRIAKMTISGS